MRRCESDCDGVSNPPVFADYYYLCDDMHNVMALTDAQAPSSSAISTTAMANQLSTTPASPCCRRPKAPTVTPTSSPAAASTTKPADTTADLPTPVILREGPSLRVHVFMFFPFVFCLTR